MTDIVDFLTARIDEDEASARWAFGDHNDNTANWSEPTSGVVDLGGPGMDGLLPTGDQAVSRFIAEFDPARVLAECAAKRAIIATRRHNPKNYIDPTYATIFENRDELLHTLATVYADHPDYDQRWRA